MGIVSSSNRAARIGVAISLVAVCVLARASAATTPAFARWTSVGSGGYSEPGVWTASDGIIYVAAPPTALWRSTDHGAHFSKVDLDLPGLVGLGGFDSDFAARGSRLYYFDLWSGSSTLLRSDDKGSTWSFSSMVSTLPASDRQWMALGPRLEDGNDTVYALSALIQPPQQVMFARSTDSGQTWTWHTAAPSLLKAKASTSRLVSKGNYVAFAWEDLGTISLAYSFDAGSSWRTTVIDEDVQSSIPGVALDGKTIYVSYSNTYDKGVRVAVSRDQGSHFEKPRLISGHVNTVFPWIDARGGKVAIAYYGANISRTYTSDNAPSGTVWTTRYVQSLDGGRTFSLPVTVGPGKTGRICTAGLACTSGREFGDFLGVTIEPGGRAVVAFGGDLSGGIKLARQR